MHHQTRTTIYAAKMMLLEKSAQNNHSTHYAVDPLFFLVLQKGFLFLKNGQFPNIKNEKLGTFYSLFFLPEKFLTA